jgi:uncharacterized delta-60 repeat protein
MIWSHALRMIRSLGRLGPLAVLAAVFVVVPIAVAAGGDLDGSFGGDGKVVTDLGDVESGEAVAIQRDGKIVVVGGSWSESEARSTLFVARYTPGGALDGSFGSGGVVRTQAGRGTSASGVAIQPDGKIVAAGVRASETGVAGSFMLVRYQADGSADRSFDGDGVVFTDFGLGGGAHALAIQPDGKLVAAGSAPIGDPRNSGEFAIARYNPDGSLDRSFDGDGRVTTTFTPLTDWATGVAVQPDGKIVVGGYAGYSFSKPNYPQRPDYALARYNPDGTLDASFDGDGKATASGTTFTGDLALQADGKILIAGGQVARFTRDGSLDSSFGQGGKTTLDLTATALLLQPDGKIIAAGGTPSGGDFALARLLPNGQYDRSFGSSGVAVTDVRRSADWATSAALQSDRRIVLAGTAEVPGSQSTLFDLALMRYLNPVLRCVVPNVRGKPLRAARASITRGRCRVGRLSGKTSQTVQKGRVISQAPRPGISLPVGGRVNLVLSKGRRR